MQCLLILSQPVSDNLTCAILLDNRTCDDYRHQAFKRSTSGVLTESH